MPWKEQFISPASFHCFMKKKHMYRSIGQHLKKQVKVKMANIGISILTEEEISYISGIPKRTLSRIFEGDRKPHLEDCLCFVIALKMSIEESFDFLNTYGFSREMLSFECFDEYLSIINNKPERDQVINPREYVFDKTIKIKQKYSND
jgi:hypothetical protein